MLNLAAMFFGRPDGLEAGRRVPFFLIGFGHADISAHKVADIMEGGAVVFEEAARGAEKCAAICVARGATKPLTKRRADWAREGQTHAINPFDLTDMVGGAHGVLALPHKRRARSARPTTPVLHECR
jgi:hypothetical protein